MYRKYKLNENYFNKLENQEQAYILGFIYADGYNSGKKLELSQNKSRLDILIKIKKALGSNAILKEYTPGKYYIYFSSIILCKDLSKLGATKNKSLTLTFPTFISDDLMPHFIRGYFDGDGCIWNGKRKKMIVKDLKYKSGFREKIIHNVKFTVTGNIYFINSLQDFLIEKLNFKKNKLNFSKSKDPKNNTCNKVCTMEYSGRTQIKSLYNYMYKDANIYCEEKYNKFNKIFCALDEKLSSETVLIAGKSEMTISSQASKSL